MLDTIFELSHLGGKVLRSTMSTLTGLIDHDHAKLADEGTSFPNV